jgi:hypothetical protein
MQSLWDLYRQGWTSAVIPLAWVDRFTVQDCWFTIEECIIFAIIFLTVFLFNPGADLYHSGLGI